LATATPVSLKLEARADHGRRLREFRRQGRLPGVIYGHNVDPVTVLVDGRDFIKAFQRVGRNQLLDLQLGEEPVRKALIREVQRSPRDGDLLHVDFYQVNLTEEIESEVPIELEGEVEIVAKGEADLQRGLHELKIECLPADLPPVITVDVSSLKDIDDELRVRDLKIPAACKVLDDPDDLIVKVAAHREEVEEAAPAPAAAEVPTVSETQAPAEGGAEGAGETES
jgi:large subunit ribosomal protein L25